jgi:hypothetical protein
MRFLPLFLVLCACSPAPSGTLDPSNPGDPTDPTDPTDPVDVDTFVEARAGRTCADSLAAEPSITLGHLTDGLFEPLGPDARLPVHAGGQGGYHSDVYVLMEGVGADQPIAGGLDLTVGMAPGGWDEGVDADVNPQCWDVGFWGYLVPVRLFWWGPEGELFVEDYCGEDPCDDNDTDECMDYLDCADEFEWGAGSPNIGWFEIQDQTASMSAVVDGPLFDASFTANNVDLVEGDEELGG